MSFAETFKALSDPVRREILVLLKNGRLSAGEIAGHFDMTQAKFLKKRIWYAKRVKKILFFMN
mgnify:CR=1 FL=1